MHVFMYVDAYGCISEGSTFAANKRKLQPGAGKAEDGDIDFFMGAYCRGLSRIRNVMVPYTCYCHPVTKTITTPRKRGISVCRGS